MDQHNLEFAQSFIESQVDAAARELELRSADLAGALMLAIPLHQAQQLVMHMLPAYAAQVIKALPLDAAASMLAEADSNQIAAVLKHMRPLVQGQLLTLLPDRIATRCRRLLKHPENTVGAWMSSDVLLLPAGINAADALQRLAGSGEIGDANLLPVVDNELKLVGYTDLKRLLRADGNTPVKMLTSVAERISLPSKTMLASAAQHPGWERQDSLIVLDQEGQPVGLLRHMTLRLALSTSQGAAATRTGEPAFGDFSRLYLISLAGLFNLASGTAQPNPPHPETVDPEPRS